MITVYDSLDILSRITLPIILSIGTTALCIAFYRKRQWFGYIIGTPFVIVSIVFVYFTIVNLNELFKLQKKGDISYCKGVVNEKYPYETTRDANYIFEMNNMAFFIPNYLYDYFDYKNLKLYQKENVCKYLWSNDSLTFYYSEKYIEEIKGKNVYKIIKIKVDDID